MDLLCNLIALSQLQNQFIIFKFNVAHSLDNLNIRSMIWRQETQ